MAKVRNPQPFLHLLHFPLFLFAALTISSLLKKQNHDSRNVIYFHQKSTLRLCQYQFLKVSHKGASSIGNWSSSGPSGPATSRGQRFPPPIPSSNQSNDVQMLMNQVRQLQEKVTELSNTSGGGASSHAGPFEAEQPLNQSILLVSNLPPSLATCDALFFMFDRFVYVFQSQKKKLVTNLQSGLQF